MDESPALEVHRITLTASAQDIFRVPAGCVCTIYAISCTTVNVNSIVTTQLVRGGIATHFTQQHQLGNTYSVRNQILESPITLYQNDIIRASVSTNDATTWLILYEVRTLLPVDSPTFKKGRRG